MTCLSALTMLLTGLGRSVPKKKKSSDDKSEEGSVRKVKKKSSKSADPAA